MTAEALKKFLKDSTLSQDFFRKARDFASDHRDEVSSIFDLPKEKLYTDLFDQTKSQSGFSFRMRNRSLAISRFLIDEKANFRLDNLEKLETFYKKKGNIFYFKGEDDGIFYEHVLHLLEKLKDKPFIRQLQRYTLPLCHQKAEEIVRLTLEIKEGAALSTADAHRVLLASLLHPLRQTVGSCFATAPAIVVQKEQPEIFLEDLQSLLYKGKLTRIINGVEYTVPWNPYWSEWEIKRRLEPREPFWYNPGFLRACQAMGIVDEADVFQSLMKIQKKVQEALPQDNIQAVFRKMLLLHYHQKDLDEHLLELERKGIHAFFALLENSLLKTWEYTLASFSDVKAEFSSWNLYMALGFAHDAPAGIGAVLYNSVESGLENTKKKLVTLEQDYEIAFDQLRATEILLKQAYRERDIRRLKSEYQIRQYHLQTCLDLRNECYQLGKWYTSLFSFLIEEYQRKLPHYFQEIYDPQMYEKDAYLYEDAPAGFRLIYKHGRTDPSVWTSIHTSKEYIESLVNFFIITEPQMQVLFENEFQKKEVESLITEIVTHIRSDSFLEGAFARLRSAHQNQDIHVTTPWSYISGGSMISLLKNYFRRQNDIFCEEAAVENPTDLLIFILDTLKSLTPNLTKQFEKSSSMSLLMYSPNHTFRLLPGLKEFSSAWQNNLFSYTWVRDELILPAKIFYTKQKITRDQQHFLFDRFLDTLTIETEHFLRKSVSFDASAASIKEFHDQILDGVRQTNALDAKQLELLHDKVDSFLFSTLPLTSSQDFQQNIRLVLEDHLDENLQQIIQNFPTPASNFVTQKEMQESAKACLVLSKKQIFFSFDVHMHIREKCEKHYISPPILSFADTNWPHYYFAFAISPTQNELELWRVNYPSTFGYPMSAWKKCFQKEKKPKWGICIAPHEYRF